MATIMDSLKTGVKVLRSLFPALLLLLPASCSNTDTPPPDPDPLEEIVFRIELDQEAEAGFKSVWANGDRIGLFAVRHAPGSGVQPAAADNYIHNVPLTWNGSLWTLPTGEEPVWPEDGDVLDFYAYYPYDDSPALSPRSIPFTVQTDQSGGSNASHLLTAKADNDGSGYEKGSTVTLRFSNAMSVVYVEVFGIGLVEDEISARLLETASGGTLDLGAAGGPQAVGNSAGTSDAIWMQLVEVDNDGLVPAYTFRALVPAQTIAGEQTLFTVACSDEEYPGALLETGHKLESGQAYTYPHYVNVNGIFSPQDLAQFSADQNTVINNTGRQAVIDKWGIDGTIYLWSDIDMRDMDFTPIGTNGYNVFTGKFDGQGYAVSNIAVDHTGVYTGLFGDFAGEVSRVKLRDCSFTGSSQCGGIAGRNNSGTIRDCEIIDSEVISTGGFSGGIVGNNNSTTVNCSTSGVKVSAPSNVGGISGGNNGLISDCHVTNGSVTADGNYAGGILGHCTRGVVRGCTVTGGDVSSSLYSGGIIGYVFNCTVDGCSMIDGRVTATNSYAGGIVGLVYSTPTLIANKVIGGTIISPGISGGITGSCPYIIVGCISAPEVVEGSARGVVKGSGGNMTECYWAQGVIPNDPSSGQSYIPPTGGSFDRGTIAGGYFTAGGDDSPLSLMNRALEEAGAEWRWQQGNADSGWYPIAYMP